MELHEHCREAADFFEAMAAQVTVSNKPAAMTPGDLYVEQVQYAHLLEGALIRHYQDKASALREAARKLQLLTSECCFVIQANDSIEHVVIGSEAEAEAMRDNLKAEYDRKTYRNNPDRDSFMFWAARETKLTGL